MVRSGRKAFTLAELIAVLVILSLLMLIVFPAVTKMLKRNRVEVSAVTLQLYKAQTELYINKHAGEMTTKNGSVYCIKLQTLIDENYLKEPLIDAETSNEIDPETYMKMSYMNSWSAELVTECESYQP